jgi:DNA-binding transcriptional regulator YiaG
MTPEAIKALRISRRETQAQFATTVGTTVTTVNRWENGVSEPSPVFDGILKSLGHKGK